MSKKLHVSLSNVENVKEMEKMKAVAAAKKVSVNVTQAYLILVHVTVYEYLSYSISNDVLKDVRYKQTHNFCLVVCVCV